VPACGPDLLFDEVIVIDEPFSRGRDASAALYRHGDQRVGLAQRELVGVEAGQQSVRHPVPRQADLVPGREGPRVLLELADAEQLGAQRQLLRAHGRRGAGVGS
jgi:hypothetical protein